MSNRLHRAFVFLVLVVWMTAGGVARAQPLVIEEPSREASELIHSLMSPFCPGLLLSDCRSEGARLLRAEIARRFAAGDTRDAIEADLVIRFGPEIRTMPSMDGIGVIAWVAPPVLGLVGLWWAVRAIRRFTAEPDAVHGAIDARGGKAFVALETSAAGAEEAQLALDARVRAELAALD